jgi:hypothetical protein
MTHTAKSGWDTALKVYRAASDLEELRGFWSSRQTAPAGELDFYLSQICSRAEFVRPHVIVIFKNGTPQSLLLGRLERRRMPVKLGYFQAPMPKIGILTFDECGWLRGISAADSELYVRSILAALRAGEADAAELQHVDTAEPIATLARSLPGRVFSDHSPMRQILWTRQLAHTGSFLASLSKNQRHNHRRQTRGLVQAFGAGIRIECFHDGSRLDLLMHDAEEIASKSYQRNLGVGFVNDESMRRRLSLAAHRGILFAHVLYLEDVPAAFWVTTLTGGVLYSDFIGFKPTYAKYSPGTYLVIKVIEEVCGGSDKGRAAAVDFGPGDAEWKRLLSNQRQQLASVYMFAPTTKGAALNLIRMAISSTDRSIKSVLERAGFLSRVKRAWRHRMAQNPGEA